MLNLNEIFILFKPKIVKVTASSKDTNENASTISEIHGLSDFKIAIFGHETWSSANILKLHMYSLSTLGVEIELIFSLQTGASELQVVFQNCYLAA